MGELTKPVFNPSSPFFLGYSCNFSSAKMRFDTNEQPRFNNSVWEYNAHKIHSSIT